MTDRTRVLPSRRTLLGGLAAAGTLAAVVMVNNGGIVSSSSSFGGALFGTTPQQSPLASAEMVDWQAAVGTRFEIAGSFAIRLAGVQPLTSVGARPAGLRRSAFMAVFELPAFATLPGNMIYTLRNSAYGQLDVFLVEGAGRAASRVFAVFN